jgi:hypothetical protein
MTRGSFGRIVGSGRPRLSAAFFAAGVLTIAGAAFPLLAGAAAPNPSPGTATIDGDPGEWDLAADLYSPMTSGSDPSRPVLATFYARYDCTTGVLSGLVLVKDGEHGQQTRPENAYLRIDGTGKAVSGLSGDDGSPPDFAWVNPDGTVADGFEASISLAPGTYTIRAHILIDDDTSDGYTSYDTIPRDAPLVLACDARSQPVDEGQPSDDGAVEGVAGTPRITPPPTDTLAVATDAPASPAAGWISVGVAFVALGVLSAIPRRRLGGRR